MGRRKRKKKAKQDTKPAKPVDVQAESLGAGDAVETQPQVESTARIVEIELEIEELSSFAETKPASEIELQRAGDDEAPIAAQVEPENPPSPVASSTEFVVSAEIAATKIATPAEVGAPGKSELTPATSTAPAPDSADRRVHPRYAFKAAAEVIAPESGTRGMARVLDLSQQGCYLGTLAPQPLRTAVEVHITQGATSMRAQARVVYSQPGKGMGLMFTSVEHAHSQILYAWIAESRETSWLAANRRRSQRVVMKLPVRLSAEAGPGFFEEEETYTLTVSAHGALIASTAPLYRGQRVTLSNVQTKGSLECVVAHIEKVPGEQTKIGVEFLLPNPMFWHVAFPPKDWTPRHPDAKARQR